MNVVEIEIKDFSSKIIEIGRQTENEVTQIKIDMSSWIKEYPKMSFLINVSRPTEDYSYPALFDMDGNYILWTILSSDTAIEGKGSIEIVGMEGTKKKLSAVARTYIVPCKQEDVSEEPPDPFKPYYDDILEAVEVVKEVKEEIPKIYEASEIAKQSAESASESEKNAQEYAQDAKQSYEKVKFIEDIIPQEASPTNKLADRQYVNNAIDEFKNNPDVVDIVNTYADLLSYNVSTLGDNDIIRVLVDESHDGVSSYYKWHKYTSSWEHIGIVKSLNIKNVIQIVEKGVEPTSELKVGGLVFENMY